jgi:hypothetical protein
MRNVKSLSGIELQEKGSHRLPPPLWSFGASSPIKPLWGSSSRRWSTREPTLGDIVVRYRLIHCLSSL